MMKTKFCLLRLYAYNALLTDYMIRNLRLRWYDVNSYDGCLGKFLGKFGCLWKTRLSTNSSFRRKQPV